MSAVVAEIVPENIIHPDVVGLYPLTFVGDIENSGDRLQVVANETGLPLLVVDLLEQKHKMIFDMQARDANRPGPNFEDASKRRTEQMLPHLDGFKHKVGIGHSLGGVIVSGMQRYGEEKPFTAVELCDAFNISNIGQAAFTLYQIKDMVRSQVMDRLKPAPELPKNNWDRFSDGENETTLIEKMMNLKELMESSESKMGALALAADAELPLHIIGFRHGLSGSARHLMPFLADIRRIRAEAAQAPADSTPLVTTVDNAWHSDLLKPSVIVPNLQQTLALLTRV